MMTEIQVNALLHRLCKLLVPALPNRRVEHGDCELLIEGGINVIVNEVTDALEVHAQSLGRGWVVSVDARMPRGYALRTVVEAVANLAEVVGAG